MQAHRRGQLDGGREAAEASLSRLHIRTATWAGSRAKRTTAARLSRVGSRSTASLLSPAANAVGPGSASYWAWFNRRSTGPTQNWPICAPPAICPPDTPGVQTRRSGAVPHVIARADESLGVTSRAGLLAPWLARPAGSLPAERTSSASPATGSVACHANETNDRVFCHEHRTTRLPVMGPWALVLRYARVCRVALIIDAQIRLLGSPVAGCKGALGRGDGMRCGWWHGDPAARGFPVAGARPGCPVMMRAGAPAT